MEIKKLTIPEYEEMFSKSLDAHIDQTFSDPMRYSLAELKNSTRLYRK